MDCLPHDSLAHRVSKNMHKRIQSEAQTMKGWEPKQVWKQQQDC